MALAGGPSPGTTPRRRIRIRVEGIVQGVGLRPYLYRLARQLGLAGQVWNDSRGVRVEVEGAPAGVAEFLARLEPEAPPLARVERVSSEELAPLGESGFAILESEAGEEVAGVGEATPGAASDALVPTLPAGAAAALVPPDVATCAACLGELFDPADRRYRYPFINCTDCGPRYTIIRELPYDRPLTTMTGFTICARCRAEYEDPADRRFHAQPNACPECGPGVWIVEGVGEVARGETRGETRGEIGASADVGAGTPDPIRATAAALRAGAIVAIKGLGGFHLACLARVGAAVRMLRERKRRPAKPFALMVPDLAAARRLVRLDPAEEALLCSRERPIVLARWRMPSAEVVGDVVSGEASGVTADLVSGATPGDAANIMSEVAPEVPSEVEVPEISPGAVHEIAPDVAPGQRELGVMLPYTPLHHLLLAELREPLVMTSGNRSDEPIAFRNDDALARLAGIADLFLLHDRPIQVPVDDSVARVITIAGERRVQLIRRARGYAPLPLRLPVTVARPVLACGGELKNTFCLARGERAWLSQHIGDLEDYETLRAFGDGVAHLEALSGTRPEVLAHDLHPEFRSTRYALERAARGVGYEDGPGAGDPRVETGGKSGTLRDPPKASEGEFEEPGRAPLEALAIQHHHAHLAACLAEHGERGPALGVIFDGTGYGPDGTVWGGEFLVGDLVGYERVGHLYPVRLPGGEAAIREPWRMACAWLVAVDRVRHRRGPEDHARIIIPHIPLPLATRIDPGRWAAVARLALTGLASPITTSMGRLFDAVGALCGLGTRASYEGEVAIALEAALERGEMGCYELARGGSGLDSGWGEGGGTGVEGRAGEWVRCAGSATGGTGEVRECEAGERVAAVPGPLVLDPRPLIRSVVADLEGGTRVGVVAARFHNGLVRATVSACEELAARYGVGTVVLSGGVFQNRELLEGVAAELARAGLRVLVPSSVPPGDGGISFGQAAIAAARGAAAMVPEGRIDDLAALVEAARGP